MALVPRPCRAAPFPVRSRLIESRRRNSYSQRGPSRCHRPSLSSLRKGLTRQHWARAALPVSQFLPSSFPAVNWPGTTNRGIATGPIPVAMAPAVGLAGFGDRVPIAAGEGEGVDDGLPPLSQSGARLVQVWRLSDQVRGG